MGRTYEFECEKCGYLANIAGGAAEGLEFAVQTILCFDCRELQDAVTSAAIPIVIGDWEVECLLPSAPPPLAELMTRLPLIGRSDTQRRTFELACAMSPSHLVRAWNRPDKCPRCGAFLECSGFPFAQWD